MGRWLDAADSVKPARQSACALQAFLDTLTEQERADFVVIFERAMSIPKGMGRYTFVHDTIVNGGGPDIDSQSISKHMRGVDQCQTS